MKRFGPRRQIPPPLAIPRGAISRTGRQGFRSCYVRYLALASSHDPNARKPLPRKRRRDRRCDRLRAALQRSQARAQPAEMMSLIVAKRLVAHLERSGFVVMKRPPISSIPGLAAKLTRSRPRASKDLPRLLRRVLDDAPAGRARANQAKMFMAIGPI